MKTCGHSCNETVAGCPLCDLAARNAAYFDHWCGEGRADIPAPTTQPIPCVHEGKLLSGFERQRLGLDSRAWRECLHLRHPLGQYVCPCQGCGPQCRGYEREADHGEAACLSLSWAIGVTAVPQRLDDLLPRTLTSLKLAGFSSPRIFLDGGSTEDAARLEAGWQVHVTRHHPPVRAWANWVLALSELYLREPHADRYAVFQDDLAACVNLRHYLDRCSMPERGYWNLYTFPDNQRRAPRSVNGGTESGWFPSNQLGKGAVGLIFSNEAVRVLLQQPHLVNRPHDPAPPKEPERPFKAIDGGVVSAMRKAGWQEWVHSPSLLQHLGDRSTLGNERHAKAESYPGEQFDALSLLR